MKKTIALLMFFTMIFFTSCGIKTDSNASTDVSDTMNDIEVLFSGEVSDSGSYTIINEYEPWSNENLLVHDREGAPSEMTVVFNGKEYAGKYSLSANAYYADHVYDHYDFDGGWFVLDPKNKELKEISLPNSGKGNLKAKDLEGEAKSLAAQYIDIDEYELSITEEYPPLIEFSFKKTVHGQNTSAILIITYGSNGELANFGLSMCDEFDKALAKYSDDELSQLIDRYTSQDALELVKEKLDSCCGNYYNFDIRNKVLFVMDTGDLAMVYEIVVDYRTDEEDGSYSIESEEINIILH